MTLTDENRVTDWSTSKLSTHGRGSSFELSLEQKYLKLFNPRGKNRKNGNGHVGDIVMLVTYSW